MSTPIKPTTVAVEKWMRVPQAGVGHAVHVFGLREFVWGKNPMVAGNDTEKQKEWVVYDVTLIVGPHWQSVRQVCPMVVASGHDQMAPDEAEAMGYEVTAINKVDLVQQTQGDGRRLRPPGARGKQGGGGPAGSDRGAAGGLAGASRGGGQWSPWKAAPDGTPAAPASFRRHARGHGSLREPASRIGGAEGARTP